MYPSGDRYFLIPLMSERPSSSISIQIQGQPPSPGIPVFDWKLCAELHNVILDIGWSVVRTETRHQPSTISWWEDHFGSAVPSPSEDKEGKDKPKAPSQTRETEGGKVAEVSPKLRSAQTEGTERRRLERKLHPDVISFLKNAKNDYPGVETPGHFFIYLEGLVQPKDIINVLNDNDDPWFHLGE